MGLIAWFKSLFSNIGKIINKAWNLVNPFLKEVLSATASKVIESLQGLAIEAVKYVATQGLPTDEAKQKAFKDYMANAAKDQVSQLKDYEINLLRETAYAIYKKATEKK